ncbi:trimeric autotransporter adhesin [Canicola haemoglobinophilus]|uniref:Trimeric autotransporter adhesin n=1 Tax=Canicola haemoglobinophilus TaxID=733 RepID=A0A377HUP9_9PAST|nr:YadA family autotransporter adhesin [Canicola haemoglobinophilus]STO59636.1 trimeric autotransporter adhesin [Canicola haemoglobinophilus]
MGEEVKRPLNTKLTVKGGQTDKTKLSDKKNIGVVSNPTDNSLEVKLAKDIDLTKDGSITIGDTIVNNDGMTIKDGPSITKSGIDAGNTTISNVKEGVKGTDAVNVNQLNRKMGDVNNRINKVNKDLQAGIAGATAMAFLQRPNLPGKSMVSAAVGGYKGQSAIAVGYARNSDNNKISIKVGVGLNSRKDVTYGGSVGYQW